jgi:hypothetical protein
MDKAPESRQMAPLDQVNGGDERGAMTKVIAPRTKSLLPELPGEARTDVEVTITSRDEATGGPDPMAAVRVERVPGDLRRYPGWENFVFDPAVFAPMTEEEMKAEGWPV